MILRTMQGMHWFYNGLFIIHFIGFNRYHFFGYKQCSNILSRKPIYKLEMGHRWYFIDAIFGIQSDFSENCEILMKIKLHLKNRYLVVIEKLNSPIEN